MNIREICQFAREALGEKQSTFFDVNPLGEAQRLAVVFAIVTAIDQYRQAAKATGRSAQTDSERHLYQCRNAIAHSTNLSTMLADPEALWRECQSHIMILEGLLDKNKVITGALLAVHSDWVAQPSQMVRLNESSILIGKIQVMMECLSQETDAADNPESLPAKPHVYLKAAIVFQLCTLGQLQFKDSQNPQGQYVRTQALISFKSYLPVSDLETVEYFQQHRDKAYHSQHANIQMLITGTFNLLMHDALSDKLAIFAEAIEGYQAKAQARHLLELFAGLQVADSENVVEYYQTALQQLTVFRALIIERRRNSMFMRNMPFDKAIAILENSISLIKVAAARRNAGEADIVIPVLEGVKQLYPIYICFFFMTTIFYSEHLVDLIGLCPGDMADLPTDNPFHMPLAIAIAYGADTDILRSLIGKKHPYDFIINDKYREALPSGYSFVHLISRMSMEYNFNERLSDQAEKNLCYILTLPQKHVWSERIPVLHTAVQLYTSMALIEHLVGLGFDLNKRITIKLDGIKIVVPIWMEAFNNFLVESADEVPQAKHLAMGELVFRFPSIDFSLPQQVDNRRGNVVDHLCKFTVSMPRSSIDFAAVAYADKTIPAAVLERFMSHCPETLLKKMVNEENSEGNTPITLGMDNAKYRMISPAENFFYAEALKRVKLLSAYQHTNLSVRCTTEEEEVTTTIFEHYKREMKVHGWPLRLQYSDQQRKYINSDALSSVVFENGNSDILAVLFDAAKSRSLTLLRALLSPLNTSRMSTTMTRNTGLMLMNPLPLVQKAQTLVTQWQAALAVIADANAQIPKLRTFTDGRTVTDAVKMQFDAKITEKKQARDTAMARIEQFQSTPIEALALTLQPLELQIPARSLHEAMLTSEVWAADCSDKMRMPAT